MLSNCIIFYSKKIIICILEPDLKIVTHSPVKWPWKVLEVVHVPRDNLWHLAWHPPLLLPSPPNTIRNTSFSWHLYFLSNVGPSLTEKWKLLLFCNHSLRKKKFKQDNKLFYKIEKENLILFTALNSICKFCKKFQKNFFFPYQFITLQI